MILLITYDLRQPNRDYESLYDAIKKCGSHWWHYLESTWLVDTNISVDECVNRLRQTMDTDDNLLVVDITGRPRQGWLPSKAWEWIKQHE
ncbi:MAG: hypothetical protein IJE43_07780 [Alphaproteobacteria bacterium]|nr:hypothetical protein [Alphaproteobacteria bacterium]